MNLMQLAAIKVDLTSICNLSCNFCPYHGSQGRVTVQSSIRTSAVTGMFAELADNGVHPQIRLSGEGEALLHRDFDHIVRSANDNGLEVRLITNGTLISDHARIIEDHVDSLVVSVHGDQTMHDALTGQSGSYAAAVGNVSRLKRNRTLQRITLSYVITPDNIEHMRRHVDLCDELGVSARFQHDFLPGLQATAYEMDSLDRSISSVKSAGATLIPDLSPDQLNRYYRSGKLVLNPHRCDKVVDEIEISSQGNIHVCGIRIGDLYRAPILDIVAGDARKKVIHTIMNEARSPGGLDSGRCDRCCYQGNYVMLDAPSPPRSL